MSYETDLKDLYEKMEQCLIRLDRPMDKEELKCWLKYSYLVGRFSGKKELGEELKDLNGIKHGRH